jgi:Flp pilus assembly protein TadD
MNPRTRVVAVVATAGAVVIAAIIGITLWQTHGESTAAAEVAATAKPRKGVPPLLFDFGFRDDAEVRDLARGALLLKQGKRARAGTVFARYHDVQAQIGSAFAVWPKGSLDTVKSIVAAHPADPVAQLHYGLALYWSGRNADAVKQFQLVDRRFPDSQSAVDAEDILYGSKTIPGLPYLIVPVSLPRAKTLAQQVAAADRAAQRPDAQAKLAYGVMLWRLDRRVSARRQLDAAARLAPNDPVTLTAAAVSRFTKKQPAAAFARLGPLSGRFPKASVVRLHLGLLLLWTKQVDKAETQLKLAVSDQPGSPYASEAKKLLSALVPNGTK